MPPSAGRPRVWPRMAAIAPQDSHESASLPAAEDLEREPLTHGKAPSTVTCPSADLGPSSTAKCGALLTVTIGILLATVMTHTLQTFIAGQGSLLAWATFALHPLLMTIAFGLLAPLAAITYRVAEDMLHLSHGSAKALHAALLVSAVVVGGAGVLDMWQVHANNAPAQRAKGWDVHFQSAHGLVGAMAYFLFVFQAAGGLTMFYGAARDSLKRSYKALHVSTGVASLVLGVAALLTGVVSLSGRGDNVAPKDGAIASHAPPEHVHPPRCCD